MKYKVKVTVIDKSCIPNCNSNIVQTPIPGCVLATMWEMNSYLSGTKKMTTFGMVG